MTNPTLRFPGKFADWKARKLGEITCHIRNGAVYDASCKSGSCMMTRIETISNGKINEAKVGYAEGIGEKYRLLFGDILYSHINSLSSLGKTVIYKNVPDKIYHGMNLLSIRADKNIVDPDFLFIILNLKKSTDWALSHGKRAINQCSISVSDIAGMDVKLPSVVEQKKIAEFFMALDKKISIIENEVRGIRELKSGISKKLFSLEVRFKKDDGANYEEWKEKKIKDLGTLNPNEGELPDEFIYVDLESVEDGNLRKVRLIKKEAAPSRAKRILKKNDVLFQLVRPYQKNNYLFSDDLGFPVVASTGYAVIRIANQLPGFVYQALLQEKFLKQVINRCTGGTYPAINAKDLGDIAILLPSFVEQEKISRLLENIDMKIAILQRKLNLYCKLRKYFMQKMFV